MMSVYSRSFPLLSFHLRYITEASTLAGENVLGSFSSEITLSRMVLAAINMSRSELRWVSSTPAAPFYPWESLVLSIAREVLAKGSRPRGQQHMNCWAYTHPHTKLWLFFSKSNSLRKLHQPPGTSCRLWEQEAVPILPPSHPCPWISLVPAVPPSPHRTFWVGFQRSDGSSPLCGSSTGGWRMEMQTSPV